MGNSRPFKRAKRKKVRSMMPQNDGMDLDPQVLIQTLNNKLAQSAVREAQMESAIMQLRSQVYQLTTQLAEVRAETEVEAADEEPVAPGTEVG